jgi:hypothetical protein
MLVKIAGKDTLTVADALVRHARKLPQELYRSLTWDRGKELAAHKRFTLATGIFGHAGDLGRNCMPAAARDEKGGMSHFLETFAF